MARKCPRCKEVKELSCFGKSRNRPTQTQPYCKDCTKLLRIQRIYGLKADEYVAMLKEQDYKCAVCGCTEQDNKKRLAVDHCHKTGKVRKLLCHRCNSALGLVDENIDILTSLISYLRENTND